MAMIKDTASNSDAWEWANNPANVGALAMAVSQLDGRIKTDALTDLLNMDLRSLKTTMGVQALSLKCQRFASLEDQVAVVEELHAQLLNMQKVRNRKV